MNSVSKTYHNEDIFNTKNQFHDKQQTRTSNTFNSNLPIFQPQSNYPTKTKKHPNTQYQPTYQIQNPKLMHDNEFYGPETIQKAQPFNNHHSPLPKQQSSYSKKQQYFNQFNSSNILNQQKPSFESFQQLNHQKDIEKEIEKVVLKGKQKEFENLRNAHKRVIDNQKSQIEDLKEYKKIKDWIDDNENAELKKKNRNYSNMFELESNPQKVGKVEGVLKNPNTVTWYQVDSVQTENQLKEYKQKEQLNNRQKKQYDLQGSHSFVECGQKTKQLNKYHIDQEYQKNNIMNTNGVDNKLDNGVDNKSRLYKNFHSQSATEYPKSYSDLNNADMQVVELKITGNLQDQTTFIRKCQQNGIHLLNYEHQSPDQQLFINNNRLKIRVNNRNSEQIQKIQKLLDVEGLKVNHYDQNTNRKNKNIQHCSNIKWSDQRVGQESCTNNNPELDCYTRKVNNLQVSENQSSKHTKQQTDPSEVHNPQSLMVMHDYYTKVNKLQRKLDRMSQQQKQRK